MPKTKMILMEKKLKLKTKKEPEHYIYVFEGSGGKLIKKFDNQDEYRLKDPIWVDLKVKNTQKEIEDFANIK
jgi:hypothetical protein